MRKAGRLAAEILDALVPFVQPGVTTAQIDDLVREMTLAGGGIPATLDRKRVVEGKSVSVRVDFRGSRHIKNQQQLNSTHRYLSLHRMTPIQLHNHTDNTNLI